MTGWNVRNGRVGAIDDGPVGRNCAALLMALDLSHDDIVRGLMNDLDLTHEEATLAALTVQGERRVGGDA